MTYFYCTTKVHNHHKVGITSSFRGIRSRLSDYRQISPGTNIEFFTEIPSKSIEDSFKDKFWHFRIANSECYDLRLDIIFKHVLKYIHKGDPKKIVTINTNLFESLIAEQLSIIQKKNPECSIGSYPYFNFNEKSGGVNIVVSSWTLIKLDHITNEIKDMISLLGGKSSIV